MSLGAVQLGSLPLTSSGKSGQDMLSVYLLISILSKSIYPLSLVLQDFYKKYHRLSGLDNRNLFPHSLGGCETNSRSCQSWFLVRSLFLASRRLSSCSLLTRPLLCAFMGREEREDREISGVPSSSHKDTSPIGLGPYSCDLI